MIHLDTNVLIGLLNRRPVVLRDRFDEAIDSDKPLSISVVVQHEMLFGAAASRVPERNEQNLWKLLGLGIAIIPFDADDAKEAADIRAHLKRLGTPIGPYDILIAAQARRRGATLVTANTREFQRVSGLQVVDWAA